MNIPRNIDASMYNAWFKKEYPELFQNPNEEVTCKNDLQVQNKQLFKE